MGFKKAMTLAETILVFIIIGIIATVTMSSLRPWEKQYHKMYARMYNALGTSIYNYMIDNNEFPRTTASLCNGLIQYLNTANNVTSCSITNLGSNPTDSNFSSSTPIILSNGVKLWFGGQNGYNCADDASKTCEYLTYNGVNYFFVYLDLNGDNKPNTSQYNFKKLADIVPMAITDKYTIIPLSYPKLDTRYLQASVIYPSQSEDDEEFESEPMPYFKAQRLAYGYNDIVLASNPLTYVEKDSKDFDWNIGSNFQIDFNNTDIKNLVDNIKPTQIDDRCSLTDYYSGATEPICRVEIFEKH